MNEVISFLKEFGSLINLVLIFSFFGLTLKIFKTTISSKDAVIEALKVQIKNVELFSVGNVTKQFQSLKSWYDNSIESLIAEKEKAIHEKEKEHQLSLEKEIQERKILNEKYLKIMQEEGKHILEVTSEHICGEYAIVGHNPGSLNTYINRGQYIGKLKINDVGEVFQATWIQNGNINAKGTGVLIANCLAITFRFAKTNSSDEHGIVLYEFITPEIMRGKWTVDGINKIGFEECRKL